MWKGYFALAGVEIGNSPRAIGYQRTAECQISWIDPRQDLPFLSDALDDETYVYEAIDAAPWYDSDDPDVSSRILGLHVISMEGTKGSTASAEVTQRITAGASIGRTRLASRSVSVRALLTANGRDALAAGDTWLTTALSRRACSVHENACRLTDFQFFVEEPPRRELAEDDTTYFARVNEYRRYMHSVKVTSGPTPTENLRSKDGQHFGTVYEFVISSEEPHVYTPQREISIPPLTPAVINDVPFNFAQQPRPENEIAPKVVAIKNLETNPSLELDATGWSGAVATVSGGSAASYFTSGRVTGELAAVGTASYRARILGNGSTSASGRARMTVLAKDVALDDVNERVSLNVWAAAVSVGGATGAALVSVTIKVDWRTAGSLLSTTTIGTSTVGTDIAGKAWSLVGQKPPATATIARVYAEFVVDWSSNSSGASNSDIRGYVDAVAVTVP